MDQYKSDFVVSVTVNKHEVFLYMPLPSEAMSLLRWVHGMEKRLKHESTIPEDLEGQEKSEAILKSNSVMALYSEGINGRVIGALWDRSRNTDFEEFSNTYGTPEQYGQALYSALYRQGWRIQEITALFNCALEVLAKASSQMVDGGQVDRHVNFSEVLGAATTSSGSAAA